MRFFRTTSLLSFVLAIGCAGTFEEARQANIQKNGLSADMANRSAEDQKRCDDIDDSATTWGFATKVLAGAAGAAGLASFPVKDDKVKDGLVIGAGSAVILALGTGYVWDSKQKKWARECSVQ